MRTRILYVVIAILALSVVVAAYAERTRRDAPAEVGAADGSVKAYFGNELLDPELDCTEVFPVERPVRTAGGQEQAAIAELLRGVTPGERERGYFTSLNDGVELNSLQILNGTAYADFSGRLGETGGSCAVLAIRAQIESTLKQFVTVDNVVISVNGRTEGILEP